MTIREYEKYDAHEILRLYGSVGWTNYTDKPEMLKNAYANSLLVLGAYENDMLLGIVRAVGDGCSVVFVQDLLVFPEYQRRGVGTALMRELIRRFPNIYQVHLMTDDTPEHTAFYQSLGFVCAADCGCCAFMKQ